MTHNHRPPVKATLRLLSLPTRDRLAAAHDPSPDERRELTIVELVDDTGQSGFGECSALNRAGYTPEWARGAFELLATSKGQAPGDAPMAAAGVEMAQLDLALKHDTLALAQHLQSDPPESVAAGIVLPLASIDDTVTAALHWAGLGITRLKLKVTPGHLLPVVTAVHDGCPSIELHVDANGSCTYDDLDELAALAEHGVTVIEQPFAENDRASSAALIQATTALIVADESATDLATIVELVEQSAANGIVIKPGRLGGLAAAVEVHDWCVEVGIGVSAGGMLECGLGRHALAALACLPGFTITGDLSPARRWLADDPFDDLTMTKGRITIPTDAGVAPPPDLELLDRFTVERVSFDWPSS